MGVTNAAVSGFGYVGALAGGNVDGDVIACWSTGSVTATNSTATPNPSGGLVEWLNTNATIQSSYSHASVTGFNHSGESVGAMFHLEDI